ncbi:MAG: hypothetical protein V1702_05430 [Candidatus Woesearchaeota archaeon]
MRKIGQSSTEYILLVAFVMVLMLPGVYIFFNSSEISRDEEGAKIENFARAVISQSERLYSMGPGATAIINERLPEGVVSINTEFDSIAGKYEMTITTDEKEYSFSCPVPISASLSGGEIGSGAVVTLEARQEADGKVYVFVGFGDASA